MALPPDTSNTPPSVRILALDVLMSLQADLPAGIIATAKFCELDKDLLARVLPDRILLALMSQEHDAMTVIERLQSLGYTGSITVVSPPLPNPASSRLNCARLARLTLLTLLILP